MKTQPKEYIDLWNRLLTEIKRNINDNKIYDAFLANSEIVKIDNNIIYVMVETLLAKKVLTSDYSALINRIIENSLESNYSISFVCEDENQKFKKHNDNEISLFANSYLKPEMNFDNFVMGESNKEAYQAALIVSSGSVKSWNPNPLFLYSDSGLGKTHLLNAIGNRIKEKDSNKKILITTAEEFFNEYMHLIKGERIEQQVSDYFKNIDVLLIDDIQFFSGKIKCQELFFTIFSDFINNNKQVVVTSDKHPNELKELENRLITRFVGGLPISINPPEVSTSIEIIKNYIKTSGMDISRIDEEVFTFFAEKFSRNVRDLKGSVNKLMFYTINIKHIERITLSNAMEAVADFLKISESNKKLNEVKIIDVVSSHYSLTPSQLTGNMRTSQIALARHIAMYLIRLLLDMPFDKIGSVFGGKDHSTVMSACKNVEKGLKNNPTLQTVIKELKEKLK